MSRSRELRYNIDWPRPDEGAQPTGEQKWFLLTPIPDDPGWKQPDSTLPFPIAVRLARDSGGRLICVGLRLGADAVPGAGADALTQLTSKDLRAIPLGAILRDLAEFRWQNPPVEVSEYVSDAVDARTEDLEQTARRPGRRGHSRSFYQRVSDLYREALRVNARNSARYIAERIRDDSGGLMFPEVETGDLRYGAEIQVRRWLSTARKKDLLGPAKHGKAGEYPTG